MLRLSFVFLAAFGASVLGLSPASGPCVAPLQWEGRWVLYDHGTGRNHRAAVSYDGLNQRIRILQQHKKHTPCQRFNCDTKCNQQYLAKSMWTPRFPEFHRGHSGPES